MKRRKIELSNLISKTHLKTKHRRRHLTHSMKNTSQRIIIKTQHDAFTPQNPFAKTHHILKPLVTIHQTPKKLYKIKYQTHT